MKKLIFPFIVLGGFLLLGTSAVEAQNVDTKKVKTTQTTQTGFVDANHDGVCDNYNGSQPGKGLGPETGRELVVQPVKVWVKALV
jgi:hypothetical protein